MLAPVNMAELDTVRPVVWPKWCYSSNPDNEATVQSSPKVQIKARRKKVTKGSSVVKNERTSPDPDFGTESSRSDSPHSPGSSSVRTPSFPGTPPNPPFTPPERFSPASYGSPKFGMEGLHMPRNYSDFMRSLAAKYNNNATNNEYRNGLVPSLDTRFGSFKPSPAAFPLLNLPMGSLGPAAAAAAAAAAAVAKKEFEAAAKKDLEAAAVGSSAKKSESSTVPLSLPNFMGALSHPFPMIDMSSTQALLNIVRSASAQNAQQLETYLGGTSAPNKRPADSPAACVSSPLDLSASVAKRPHLEPSPSVDPVRGFRDLFGLKSPVEAESKSHLEKKAPVSPSATPAESPRAPHKAETSGCKSTCAAKSCSPGAIEVNTWTVNEVIEFVKSIEMCTEYAEVFGEHSIDGSTLPLLTEDHLMNRMNMKLGPALKFRSALAKKIGHCALCMHCVHCHQDNESSDNN